MNVNYDTIARVRSLEVKAGKQLRQLSTDKTAMFSRLPYVLTAGASGILWYIALSLPISPVSREFLVGDSFWLNWPAIGMLCIGTLISALILRRWILTSPVRIAWLPGVVLTFVSGLLFSLLVLVCSILYEVFSGEPDYPLYGGPLESWILIEALLVASYGILYVVLSAHVALPTGIAIVYLLRAIDAMKAPVACAGPAQ